MKRYGVEKAYRILIMSVVRIDLFIMRRRALYAGSVPLPGTEAKPASIPQQVKCMGWSMTNFILPLHLEECLHN